MEMKVIKRDGTTVGFDRNKIENAILSAMKNGSGIYEPDIAELIAEEVECYFEDVGSISIAQIESEVFDRLNDYKQTLTAKMYESYRAVREYQREVNITDEGILGIIDKSNEDVLRENSNKDSIVSSTQRDLIAGEVSKDIARRKLIPTYLVQAHDEGVLHFHDLDYTIQPIFNCCLINLEDMLQNGTVINSKLVEKPKSFTTACTVVTQIMAQIASNQYGGQSITMKHLAPFVRISEHKHLKNYTILCSDKWWIKLIKKIPFINKWTSLNNWIKNHVRKQAKRLTEARIKDDVKAGIQTIRYQLSTLQTSNGQAPFATIYLEIEEGHEYEEEMALLCEEMIKQRIDGMKNEKGQEIGEAFPKLVYLLDEHNCLEGGKYDYITKLSAVCNTKRLVPDYQSAKIMRQNYGDTFPPMGCRSHLSQYKDENGDLKWYGRFNQGVVSLNLPQIGILAKGDINQFYDILDERLETCKEALLVRHNLLLGTLSDVSPIHWQHGGIARLRKGEKIDKLLKDGYSTLSLGYVGVSEMVQAMLGESNTSEQGQKFSLEIVSYMKQACDKWREETGLGFSLYGTPAENLVYRFCRIDKQKFGEIPNVTDKLYYTNSYHVNVTEEIDAFSKLSYEAPFHSISTGGCISYIETPNMSNNLKAVEQIINFIYHNVQYAEINSRPDVCYKCGFRGEILTDENLEWYCPNCGNKDQQEMQVMRRTCGYIGTSFWNKGRTEEISERVFHIQ